jgi:hypothetical protein
VLCVTSDGAKPNPYAILTSNPDMEDAMGTRSSGIISLIHWSPYKTSERKSNHDREENHFGIGASGQCNNGYFGERTWRRLHSM